MKGRKYQPLTNGLAKFVYAFIDRYDYGLKLPRDPNPKRAFTTDSLNGSRWGLRKITKTDLEDHLFGEVRFYYTTTRRSRVAFLKIDIDAHDGERDAWDAAEWIVVNCFPGAYMERSTHGKGAHIYLAVHVGYLKRHEANAFFSDFGEKLRCLVAEEGFESQVCGVYGNYTIRKDGNIPEGGRGHLAKIPRPLSQDDLDRLIQAPWFTWDALKTVVDDAVKMEQERGEAAIAADLPSEKVNRLLTTSRAGEGTYIC